MSDAQYEPVPVAVPRRWLKDWMLNVWTFIFGHTLGTVQPFRWIMFRELTVRERMALLQRSDNE